MFGQAVVRRGITGREVAQEHDQPIRCWCWCGSTRGSNVGRCKPTYQGGGSGWLCWFAGVCVEVCLVGGGRGFLTNQLLDTLTVPVFVHRLRHFRLVPSAPPHVSSSIRFHSPGAWFWAHRASRDPQ